VEFADVDWKARDPMVIFGMTHEPFTTVLSIDGGKTWQQPDKETETGERYPYRLGVINRHALARGSTKQGGIELSTDDCRTWNHVADYEVTAFRPVHYGKRIYWTTKQGVIVTTDGKKWTLTGAGAEDASYGPYFGASDKEFMVVTSHAFLATKDGGKTWNKLADFFLAPDIFNANPQYCYFGWDAKHHLLYSSGLGASVYQLEVKAPSSQRTL
jgi:photosystem II stability/assembly factor-like uncharacterized protein